MRQTEPTIEKIGNKKFYLTPFPAFKAANLTGELASVLTPLFGAFMPLVSKKESEKEEADLFDLDVGKAAEAMTGCTVLDGDKLEKLMKKLLLGGHIVVEVEEEEGALEPQKLDLELANEIFCGEVQEMFVLCFYVIRLNFNGFFKNLGGLSGKGRLPEGKGKRKIL